MTAAINREIRTAYLQLGFVCLFAVFFFYPADFTGGCTSQACAYRDDIEKLGSKGVEVIGVSGDSAKTHELFKSEHKFPFTLLADDGSIAGRFGVPYTKGTKQAKRKTPSGKEIDVTMNAVIQRYTVVIDKAGNVAAIDNVGKGASGDAKRVAELVKKLEK